MAVHSRRRSRRPVLINPFAVREEPAEFAVVSAVAVGTLLVGAAGLVVLGASPASAGEPIGGGVQPGPEYRDQLVDHREAKAGQLLVDPEGDVGLLHGDPPPERASAVPPTTSAPTGTAADAVGGTDVVAASVFTTRPVPTEGMAALGDEGAVVSPALPLEPVLDACPLDDTSDIRGTDHGLSGNRVLVCRSPGAAPRGLSDLSGTDGPVAVSTGGSVSSGVPVNPVLPQDGFGPIESADVLVAATGDVPDDQQVLRTLPTEVQDRILHDHHNDRSPTDLAGRPTRAQHDPDHRGDRQRGALDRDLSGDRNRAEWAPPGPGVDLAAPVNADRLRIPPHVDELDGREAVSRLGPVDSALFLRLPDDEQGVIFGLPGILDDLDRLRGLIRSAAAEHGLLDGRLGAPGAETATSPSERLWSDIKWPGPDHVFLRSSTRLENIPPDPRRAGVIDHVAGPGAEALAALRNSEYRIESDADWYRAVAAVAGQLRRLGIGSSPLSAERARQLFPVLTEEELAREQARWSSPLMVTELGANNDMMAEAQRAGRRRTVRFDVAGAAVLAGVRPERSSNRARPDRGRYRGLGARRIGPGAHTRGGDRSQAGGVHPHPSLRRVGGRRALRR